MTTHKVDLDGGRVQLWCANCLDVLPTLAAGSVDAVVMDSPYSDKTHAGHNASANGHLGGGLDDAHRRSIEYAPWSDADIEAACSCIARVCRGWTVHFCDHTLAPMWADRLEGLGRYVFAPLPFYAPGSRCRLSGDGPSSWTTWLVVSRTAAQSRWGTLPGGYVDERNEPRAIAGAKPLGVMLSVVNDYSRPNDVVCDPTMGSGTTGVACVRTGRKFVGVEISREYYEIAVSRIKRELELRDGRGPLFDQAKQGLFHNPVDPR